MEGDAKDLDTSHPGHFRPKTFWALVHFRTLVTLRRVRVRVGLELRLGLELGLGLDWGQI